MKTQPLLTMNHFRYPSKSLGPKILAKIAAKMLALASIRPIHSNTALSGRTPDSPAKPHQRWQWSNSEQHAERCQDAGSLAGDAVAVLPECFAVGVDLGA